MLGKKFKRYEIPLGIVNVKDGNNIGRIALAKYLMENMTSDELYEVINLESVNLLIQDINRPWWEYLEALGIEHRIDEFQGLKNYDVALSMSMGGKLDDSKNIMEYLRKISNPKKDLDINDFEQIQDFENSVDAITEQIADIRKKLEHKEIRNMIVDMSTGNKND